MGVPGCGPVPSAERSLLRAEGFYCILDVLYGAVWISKLQFLIKKDIFSCCYFFQFLVIKTLDEDLDPDSLDLLDPDPESMNPDPQQWLKHNERNFSIFIQVRQVPEGSEKLRSSLEAQETLSFPLTISFILGNFLPQSTESTTVYHGTVCCVMSADVQISEHKVLTVYRVHSSVWRLPNY